MDNSQNILRLAAAAAILLVGVSVAYHYVIYIPAKDEAARNYLVAKEDKAKAETDERARRAELADKAKASAAQQRRAAYQVCVSSAQTDYGGRWAASCKRLASQSDQDRQNCVARGTAASTCFDWYPVRSAESCALPTGLAKDYDDGLKDDKERCFREASIQAAIIE